MLCSSQKWIRHAQGECMIRMVLFLHPNRNNFQNTESILTLRSHHNRCHGSCRHPEALCVIRLLQWWEDSFIQSLAFRLEGQAWQEPEPSHVTGMALAHCILGKFLGVVFHCFPPPLDIPTLAARCLRTQ